jgi:hypothetical protein
LWKLKAKPIFMLTPMFKQKCISTEPFLSTAVLEQSFFIHQK